MCNYNLHEYKLYPVNPPCLDARKRFYENKKNHTEIIYTCMCLRFVCCVCTSELTSVHQDTIIHKSYCVSTSIHCVEIRIVLNSIPQSPPLLRSLYTSIHTFVLRTPIDRCRSTYKFCHVKYVPLANGFKHITSIHMDLLCQLSVRILHNRNKVQQNFCVCSVMMGSAILDYDRNVTMSDILHFL